MTRLLITANGNYTVPVPVGGNFSLACSGTFDSATVAAQYNTGMTLTSATGTLTVDGVAIHGETVTIGDDVYAFAADEAQTVTAGQIPVDITAVATASQGKLTIAVQPAAGETITIGTNTYTFVTSGAGEGEISRGADLAAAKVNIVGAIKGTDGHSGNDLATCAAAFVGNDLTITAKIAGAAGDLIVTTETMANAGNVFDAVTLGTTTAGADCVQADAVAALVAADAGTSYSLANGAGDTVTVTATAGLDGNAIATSTDMAHGAFGGDFLTGGTDPVDRYVGFSTTAVSLTAAGEKTGTNFGAHNEINLAVTGKAGTTATIIAIVNNL